MVNLLCKHSSYYISVLPTLIFMTLAAMDSVAIMQNVPLSGVNYFPEVPQQCTKILVGNLGLVT